MPDPLIVEFTIPGNPQQQGSKKSFYVPKLNRVIDKDDNDNLKPWRAEAIAAAREAMPLGSHPPLYTGAVAVFAAFIFGRRTSDYRTGRRAGELLPSAPYYKISSPDLDKLQRALGDALEQSRLIHNDNLIVRWFPAKIYGDRPEVRVTVAPPFGNYTTSNPAAQGTVWSSSGVAVELLGPGGNHISDGRLPLPTEQDLLV